MREYIQSTEFTGAASSLLMVLNHYNKTRLTKENEFRIWMQTVNLPTRASSVYGIAAYAYKKGLKPKVIVGKKHFTYPDYRFKGYTKDEIKAAKFSESLHLKDLMSYTEIEERNLGISEITNAKISIVRLDSGVFRPGRPSSSYVVLSNEDLYDPSQGKINLPEGKLRKSYENLKNKRKRDHRALIFS